MAENPKTHAIQNVQYDLYVHLFENEEDLEPFKTINILFPLNHAPTIPRQYDLYLNNSIAHVVTRISHSLGADDDDDTLGRHIINVAAIRAPILAT
jgi:hypothetical protein